MVETYELIKKIDNTIVIKATAMGESLGLRIPKEILEVYHVVGGDFIRVNLRELYRQKKDTE